MKLMTILCFFSFFSCATAQFGVSIGVDGGVEYVVTDPSRRMEGINPIKNQRYREINNSYGVFSIDSEDPDVAPPEPVNEFMTHDPVEGTYQLNLYGTRLARYRLSIVVDAQDKGKGFQAFGTIDSAQERLFTFEYVNDSTAPFIVKRVISGSTLREDLSNCFRLKFLGNQSLYKEFTEHIDQIEKRLDRGDSSKASEELEKLADKLKKEREETVKHEERKQKLNRFVTAEAYSALNEDITIMAASLGAGHKKR